MKNKSLVTFGLLWALFFQLTGAALAATVSGQINFEGAAPAVEPIAMDADPTCAATHAEAVQNTEVIVNPNNTLRNVFIYVKQGLEGKTFPAATEPVKFDQKGCMYDPHVFGIRVNQPIEIINSDATLHNVHALPTKSDQFNLGMPIQGMKLKKTFTQPEVMVKIKCEVHPWMAAYAGVLDHPFFSVSDDQGAFELKDLPPGEYVVEAWHEKYGTQTQTVTVTDQPAQINFSFKAA